MLHIDTLTRRFGAQTALNGVSLDIPAGKVACLVGPSGCGKSTLLRLVAGLDRPDGGSISIGGKTLSSPGWALEPHKRRLNMVFQDYALWPHMTVEKIVGYGLDKMSSADRGQRVGQLLEQLQIAGLARRLPSQISGGQQQRVAIARALATDPDILLLDEPLSNLDVQLRLEMRKEFSVLFGAVGKTVLYVTHDPLEAASFADILVVMKDGEIEQIGAPDALFEAPRSAWIATLAGFDTTIDAKLEGRDDAGLLVAAVGDQRVRLAPQSAPGLDTADTAPAITIMLPSDRVAVGDGEATSGHNRLTGRVTHCLFEGRSWRIVIAIGANSVSAVSPQRTAIGETIELTFAPDAALAFRR